MKRPEKKLLGACKGLLGFALVSSHETPELRDILSYNQRHLMMDALWGVKEGSEVEGRPEVSNCGDWIAVMPDQHWDTHEKGMNGDVEWGGVILLSLVDTLGLKSH